MEIKDARLPDGIAIFHNSFDEYVAVKEGVVAKINGNSYAR